MTLHQHIVAYLVALLALPALLSSQSQRVPRVEQAALGELAPIPIPATYDLLWQLELASWLSDKERAAYEALSSPEHREAFRQAFWRSRDLTPNLQLNEVKEHFLHYLVSSADAWPGANRGTILGHALARTAAVQQPAWRLWPGAPEREAAVGMRGRTDLRALQLPRSFVDRRGAGAFCPRQRGLQALPQALRTAVSLQVFDPPDLPPR